MDREAPVVAVADQDVGHQPLFCRGGYPMVVGIVRIGITGESGAQRHSAVRGHLTDRVELQPLVAEARRGAVGVSFLVPLLGGHDLWRVVHGRVAQGQLVRQHQPLQGAHLLGV